MQCMSGTYKIQAFPLPPKKIIKRTKSGKKQNKTIN